jgi:hypothetical protein
MRFFLRGFPRCFVFGCAVAVGFAGPAQAQSSSSSSPSTSSSARHTAKSSAASQSGIDAGEVVNGAYRNRSLALTVKIPSGWVLRTDELNAREESYGNPGGESAAPAGGSAQAPAKNPGEAGHSPGGENKSSPARASSSAADEREARVLLAAFSRPPEARGEDVNGSIVIAAESVATYPGLTEAAQYFGPVTEVAKAQGFTVDEEPYEFALGNKNVVRGDFHKDVGTRVMRQSTLAFLSHGYAVSITVIGGSEDQVEELIDGLSFAAGSK